MKGRGLARKIMLIALIFFISYIINICLIFSNQPLPWGSYTAFIITAIACIIAFLILLVGRENK